MKPVCTTQKGLLSFEYLALISPRRVKKIVDLPTQPTVNVRICSRQPTTATARTLYRYYEYMHRKSYKPAGGGSSAVSGLGSLTSLQTPASHQQYTKCWNTGWKTFVHFPFSQRFCAKIHNFFVRRFPICAEMFPVYLSVGISLRVEAKRTHCLFFNYVGAYLS